MPRKARVVSKTNIYHVMLRGVNQQIIFEDEEDFRYFISILSMCRDICGYTIFAYCLMNNHIHLLMEGTLDELLLKSLEKKEDLAKTIVDSWRNYF